MKIKNWVVFALSMVALAVGLVSTSNRIVFISGAARTIGTVKTVSATDARCGGKHSHDCTKFKALIEFSAGTRRNALWVEAGEARGHHQPVSAAQNAAGDQVPVLYNPRNLEEAFRDTFWDVWGTPLVSLILFGVLLAVSFTEGRRRNLWVPSQKPPASTNPAPVPPDAPTPPDSSGPKIKVI